MAALLACSGSVAHLSAKVIVARYAQRMRIEQEFAIPRVRGLAWGLENSGTRELTRLAVWVLIAALAQWVLHLLGQWVHDKEQQRQRQLTNRRTRPELSMHRLGWLLAHVLDPPIKQLWAIIRQWVAPNTVRRHSFEGRPQGLI